MRRQHLAKVSARQFFVVDNYRPQCVPLPGATQRSTCAISAVCATIWSGGRKAIVVYTGPRGSTLWAFIIMPTKTRVMLGGGYVRGPARQAELWGSQSWLQPAFSRRLRLRSLAHDAKKPPKGGCGQDCPPHKTGKTSAALH
jgi:hypothetical protein